MATQGLESRVEPLAQNFDKPIHRFIAAVPVIAMLGAVGVIAYTSSMPQVRAERDFRAKYSDVHAGRADVNGDGEFEYVISYRNPNTRAQEQRILQFQNGQPVLRRFEVKDGKIMYLD